MNKHNANLKADQDLVLQVNLKQSEWAIVMGCVMACAPSGGGSLYKRIAESMSDQLVAQPILDSKVIWATMAVLNEAEQAGAIEFVGKTKEQMMTAYSEALIEEQGQ